jgi:hypothetical protein
MSSGGFHLTFVQLEASCLLKNKKGKTGTSEN